MRHEHEHLGSLLKRYRKEADYSREHVSKETGLSTEFIARIENDPDFDPEVDIYTKGKTDAYVRFLKIPASVFEAKEDSGTSSTRKDSRRPLLVRDKISSPIVTTNVLIQAIVFFMVGGLIAYIAWQIMLLTGNPQLHVEYPPDQEVITSSEFDIVGSTSPGSEVTIDGRPVLVNDDGDFRLPLTLSDGTYEFDIEARSGVGRSERTELTVIVDTD